MPRDVQGFLPGGEDRVQWFFEGEWAEQEMQPCLDLLHEYIQAYREKYSFDMVAWFRFSWEPFFNGSNSLCFVTRRGWLYSHMGRSIEEMLEKLRKDLATRVPLKEIKA